MSEELLIVGIVLLVVGFAFVPEIVDEVVPSVVDRILKSVERVAMAVVNRMRPADPLLSQRIKELEAEVASLTASVQQLAVAEKALVEHVARSEVGNSRETENSM